MQKYDIIEDELKRLTNRCIAKTLESLGDSINLQQTILIKQNIRMFENNIRNNILNAGHSHEQNLR